MTRPQNDHTGPGNGPIVNRARNDPRVRDLLESSASHTEVANLLGVRESSVRRYRQRHGVGPPRSVPTPVEDAAPVVAPGRFTEEDRERLHERLDTVLDEVLAHGMGKVKGVTVRQWEGFQRGLDGTPQVVQLQGIKLDVKVNEVAPEWPVIDRPSVTLRVIPPERPRPRHPRDRVAVILPDPQIGFRLFDGGELDPFHDENAIDVAMQLLRDVAPDRAICLGDFQDFAEFGKYTQEAAFARTTQKGIDRGHEFIAQMRQAAPDAQLTVMEGNHDRRMEKRILENNMGAMRLHRAADTTGWPVFSVPYLCAFDSFGCEYVGAYPSGTLWINDRLRCIHGIKVRSNSSTAAAVVKDDDVSTIFGHVHRLELQYLTRHTRKGAATRVACSPGCLCRIDGAVPSVKGSTALDGRPVTSYENWQQGLAVVHYREGNSPFSIDLVHINTQEGYTARYNDKLYLPRRRRSR